MDPRDMLDLTIGPHPFRVCLENVADFISATGDDHERWAEAAPPGFIAAALFAVASDLLRKLSDRSVIHGEQTFTWHRRLDIETQLQVSGQVSRVRERSGVDFVTFDVTVEDQGGKVADASSLFLVSVVDASAAVEERVEPAPEDNGGPAPGEASASRADLVRYAAATRDWNPIHWDHSTAVAAGLPGVVAHGLLQAAWAFVAASRLRPGDRPLGAARVRFRNPLPPANPVTVSVIDEGDAAVVAVADGAVEYVNARVELAEG